MRVVFDTNVLVAALRSRQGASFRIAQWFGSDRFEPIVSPPLCLEYEDVLKRPGLLPTFSANEIDDFLNYFLSTCTECRIHFLWRPQLVDPKDDLLLELALAGGATVIVTHNTRHFRDIELFGIRPMTPGEFLRMLQGS